MTVATVTALQLLLVGILPFSSRKRGKSDKLWETCTNIREGCTHDREKKGRIYSDPLEQLWSTHCYPETQVTRLFHTLCSRLRCSPCCQLSATFACASWELPVCIIHSESCCCLLHFCQVATATESPDWAVPASYSATWATTASYFLFLSIMSFWSRSLLFLCPIFPVLRL